IVRQSLLQNPPRPPREYTQVVDADFNLQAVSRWHLLGVSFLPESATRPTFANTIFPRGTGITVHAVDEGRLLGAIGRQAFVKLTFDIDEHGVPGHFRVLNASLDLWGDEAISLVSQWRFNPGRKNGDAVAVPCTLDLGWGPRELSIEAAERLKAAIDDAGQYS